MHLYVKNSGWGLCIYFSASLVFFFIFYNMLGDGMVLDL